MSDHKLESACNYWDNQATNLIRPCQQEIPNYIFFTIPLGSAVAKHFKFSLIFVASLVSWKLKKIAMQTSQKNCTASFWLYSYYNIASEASNVYILSGQKSSSLASFSKTKTCGQTVLPGKSILITHKLVENVKFNETFWVIFIHCGCCKIEVKN